MAVDQFTAGPILAAHDPFEATLARMNDEAGDEGMPAQQDAPDHPLDSENAQRLWKKLQGWLNDEKAKQAHNRLQMAIDHDFYDHLQWRGQDIDELADRGQAPLVYNRCALAVNWLYGSAIRTKVDGKVKPRERDDEPLAPVKTKVLKYVNDVNHAVHARLRAYKDALKGGIGWIDHGIDTDPTSELVSIRFESWRYVWHDSHWRDPTYKDGRYVFREKDIDLDVGVALWPARAALLRSAASQEGVRGERDVDDEIETGLGGTHLRAGMEGYAGVADAWDSNSLGRQRVRVTEGWYRVPEPRYVLRGEVFHGRTLDPSDPQFALMQRAVEEGAASAVYNVTMRVRLAIWCDEGLLWEGPSPYRHNRFPLVPVVCYRRDRDGAPYGIIRGMRDAQEDYNKRASKALHLLSTRGLFFESGAFEDEEEAREEVSRPDFFLAVQPGRKWEFVQAPEIARGHIDLMMLDGTHMESSSGVTNELVALDSNAVSGRAIEKRQQQGQLTTTEPTENFRLAQQLSNEITLSMIEQFYSEARVIRIAGEDGADEWLEINRAQQQSNGEFQYLDDITARQADFVMDEIDYRESARSAMSEQALDFIAKLPPEHQVKMLDLAIELMADLPNRTEFVRRARQIAGVPDPEQGKTPEGQAELRKQQQKAEILEQVEMRALMAQVAKAEAEAAKAAAAGDQAKSSAIKARIDAVNASLQAAMQILSVPMLTPAADTLLEGVGMGTALDPALGVRPAVPAAMPAPPQ